MKCSSGAKTPMIITKRHEGKTNQLFRKETYFIVMKIMFHCKNKIFLNAISNCLFVCFDSVVKCDLEMRFCEIHPAVFFGIR